MTKKTQRRFSDELKADAVRLVIDKGDSASEAARRLGVERRVLDRWCRKHRQQVARICSGAVPAPDSVCCGLLQAASPNSPSRPSQ